MNINILRRLVKKQKVKIKEFIKKRKKKLKKKK